MSAVGPTPATGAGALQIGVFVPQGWKLEYSGWSGPDAWHRSVELARLAESLGYDHLWVYDHVETVPRREPPTSSRRTPCWRHSRSRRHGSGWASW